MQKRKSLRNLTLGSFFAALFFIASNMIPPINIFPAVPLTFQVLVVILMAAAMGLRWGGLTLSTIYLLTLVGVPMFSGFSGGLAAFTKPTAGYIIGFLFYVLLVGIYTEFIEPNIFKNGSKGIVKNAAVFVLICVLAALLQYLCGVLWLAIYNKTLNSFLDLFLSSTLTFIWFDILKAILAFIIYKSLKRRI